MQKNPLLGPKGGDRYNSAPHLKPLIYWCARTCPALPGLARLCPDLRVKPTRFQAYSSRAGTLEGSRLAKHKLPQTTTTTTTTTFTINYCYYYYYLYYYYYYYY